MVYFLNYLDIYIYIIFLQFLYARIKYQDDYFDFYTGDGSANPSIVIYTVVFGNTSEAISIPNLTNYFKSFIDNVVYNLFDDKINIALDLNVTHNIDDSYPETNEQKAKIEKKYIQILKEKDT